MVPLSGFWWCPGLLQVNIIKPTGGKYVKKSHIVNLLFSKYNRLNCLIKREVEYGILDFI